MLRCHRSQCCPYIDCQTMIKVKYKSDTICQNCDLFSLFFVAHQPAYMWHFTTNLVTGQSGLVGRGAVWSAHKRQVWQIFAFNVKTISMWFEMLHIWNRPLLANKYYQIWAYAMILNIYVNEWFESMHLLGEVVSKVLVTSHTCKARSLHLAMESLTSSKHGHMDTKPFSVSGCTFPLYIAWGFDHIKFWYIKILTEFFALVRQISQARKSSELLQIC